MESISGYFGYTKQAQLLIEEVRKCGGIKAAINRLNQQPEEKTRGIIGDLFSSASSMKPFFSSSFKRIERILGVIPSIDSRRRLKRVIL